MGVRFLKKKALRRCTVYEEVGGCQIYGKSVRTVHLNSSMVMLVFHSPGVNLNTDVNSTQSQN